MYKDYQYFLNEAERIINQYSVKYDRITSGHTKGEYVAKLKFPEELEGDSFHDYLLNTFGCYIKYYTQYSRKDKDGAKLELTKEIASSLSECDKRKNKQPISDLWKYFNETYEGSKNDIYYEGRIGRDLYNYFEILNGRINNGNWKNIHVYKNNHNISIGTVTNFKELYYYIKQTAKNAYLKNNQDYRERSSDSKELTTFVFDEENIPEIVGFEKKFDIIDKSESIKNINNDLDKITTINTDSLPNSGFVKIGYRKKHFLETAILVGREREVVFPSKERHKSFFAIVELDEILASHNEESFASTNNYPTDASGKNINDRNYAADKNAQGKVFDAAQNLDPNIIISTSATSSGTPIITIDGIVVSGNNRTMSLKRAKNMFPDVYDKYKKDLRDELNEGGYGISGNSITQILMGESITVSGSTWDNPKKINIKNPVLVRIDIDFPEYTMGELNKYNKSTKKSEREIDVAIRLSQQIKDNKNCTNALVELIADLDVVSELYNNSAHVLKLKKILLDCGIITDNEIASLFKDNTLTENGKVLYETILLSLVLDVKSIEISQNAGIKSFTNNIVNAIMPLIKNKALPNGSLIPEINNAMLIKNDLINNKYNSLSQYATEQALFDNEQSFKTDKAIILTFFINGSINMFKNALKSYNHSVSQNDGADMFGDSLTPEQVFEMVFIKNTDETILKSLQLRKKEQENNLSLQVDNEIDIAEAKKIKMSELLKKAQKYL